MKTTIELPDDLFAEAKATAARRRTTLKAIIEHALRRELRIDSLEHGEDRGFTIDEHGLPLFAKTGATIVTDRLIDELREDLGV